MYPSFFIDSDLRSRGTARNDSGGKFLRGDSPLTFASFRYSIELLNTR